MSAVSRPIAAISARTISTARSSIQRQVQIWDYGSLTVIPSWCFDQEEFCVTASNDSGKSKADGDQARISNFPPFRRRIDVVRRMRQVRHGNG